MEFVAAATAGLTVLLLFTYLVRERALRPSEARLQNLGARRSMAVEATEDGQTILRREASSIPAIARFLNHRGYTDRWQFDLERAGLTLRPGEYFLMRFAFGIAAFAIMLLILRSPLGFVIGCVVGAAAFMLPAFWVKMRIGKRVSGIEKQLVEALTLISNAQRSGFAFAQGVDLAAKRVGPPISIELNRMLLDINLGASTEDALVAMNERIDSEDLDLVVTAILIHRQTGGNLAEILDNVTETMRDRERIKGEIKTLTSSQRLSGWILSLWPGVLALMFVAIAPKMMSLLVTTTAGLVMLAIWVLLNVLAFVSIRRILDIDI
jgi:tight adherence protein B